MTSRRPLLAEPPAREQKPRPHDIPTRITHQIEQLAGAKIVDVTFTHGGLSVSAAFIVDLHNGTKVFAKGAHPGDTAHATKNLEDEISVYKSVAALKDFAPRYIGLAHEGEWMLGVWAAVEHKPVLATPARAIESLKQWQGADAAALPAAREHVYISQLLSGERKWRRLRDDDIARKKFFGMFAHAETAQRWFAGNIAKLCKLQERAAGISNDACLLHGDLRLDNFLFGDSKTWVIDWPNACRGPRVFDPVFLFSNLEALGFGKMEDFFASYGAVAAEDVAAVLGSLSGYFADQAYRDIVEKMPRLRWMQRSMLLAQLHYMARLGLIESPPKMSGENQ